MLTQWTTTRPSRPPHRLAYLRGNFNIQVVTDSSEVIEPDVPRVSAHIGDGFVHVFMMALMQSYVKDGAGR